MLTTAESEGLIPKVFPVCLVNVGKKLREGKIVIGFSLPANNLHTVLLIHL